MTVLGRRASRSSNEERRGSGSPRNRRDSPPDPHATKVSRLVSRRESTLRRVTQLKDLEHVDAEVSNICDAYLDRIRHWKCVTPEFAQGLRHFWSTVLTGEPSNRFAPLLHLSLRYWITAYTAWAASRKHPTMVSGLELMKYCQLDASQAGSVMKVMDPALPIERVKKQWLQRHQVNFLLVIMGGVFSSQAISPYQKVRFSLALFDFDYSQELNVTELGMAFKTILRALCSVYQVKVSLETAVIDAWAQRIHAEVEPDLEAAAVRSAQVRVSRDGLLSFDEVSCWVLVAPSILALPWRLLAERFSRSEESDCFDPDLDNFTLDPTRPMPPHRPPCALHPHGGCAHLERKTVLAVKELFDAAQETGCTETAAARLPLDSNFHELELQQQQLLRDTVRPDDKFLKICKALSPCAQAAHLKLYARWFSLHERFRHYHDKDTAMTEVLQLLEEHQKKPALPDHEIVTLTMLFRKCDIDGSGVLTFDELVESGIWRMDDARIAIEAYDLDGSASLDEPEFLRLMCPNEYRVPCMVDDAAAASLAEAFAQFAEAEQIRARRCSLGRQRPEALLENAAQDQKAAWRQLFRQLDVDADGRATMGELRRLNVFDDAVARQLARWIGEDRTSFTEDELVEALAMAQGKRAFDRKASTFDAEQMEALLLQEVEAA